VNHSTGLPLITRPGYYSLLPVQHCTAVQCNHCNHYNIQERT